MTINRTTLLDLPLPVTGTESGTWGNITNNGLSQYVDIAVAGMNALTSSDFTAGALTISNTLGTSAATNIAAGSAQYATIKVSSLAQNSTITAPASNRSYRIINADSTYNLTIKASGQAGITFLPGQTGVVAFTGTDYEVVGVVNAASSTDNAVPKFDGTTGQIIQNTGVTIDGSNVMGGITQLNVDNLRLDGNAITSTNTDGNIDLTPNGTGEVNISKVDIDSGTIDGTVIGGSTADAGSFTTLNTSGAVVFNDAGADVDFRVEGDTDANLLFVDASTDRVGIGTSTPTSKLEVYTGTGAFNAVQAQFNASNTPIVFACNNSNGDAYLGHNTVQVSGTDGQTYAITNAAAKIRMNGGSFQFNIAPSGTAGDPITFTQAMTLDASGNLGIGTSSPAQRLHILGASAVSARARVENASGYLIDVYAGVSDGVGLATGNNMMFFEVNSAERMRIDTSGNVGIGTSSPLTNLHVRVNALSGYTSVANSGLLIERGNGPAALNIASPNTESGFIWFADQDSASVGNIAYNHASNFMSFQTNGSERARIDSSGNVGIGTSSPSTHKLHDYWNRLLQKLK
jgi:hypothetical protein